MMNDHEHPEGEGPVLVGPTDAATEVPEGFRSGFVALIGRPNAGKSTLLNQLLGEKVAIATPRPQTTRNRLLGIYNEEALQVAFLDTPGIHKAQKGLNRYMVEVALSAIGEVDAVLFLVDAEAVTRRLDPDDPRVTLDEVDREIAERIAQAKVPAVLGINKVDAVPKALLLPLIDAYKDLHPWEEVLPLSALKGEGVAELPGLLSRLLPESPPLFPPDVLTDQAERFIAAEFVREQVIRHTHQEVPYSVGVEIVLFDEAEREGRGLVRIEANVVVERDSQKGIVIGKGGKLLKTIGSAARRDLERMLGARVWLGLHVRVEKDWTRSPKGLRKLGYE